MDDNLTAPLTEDEAAKVLAWTNGLLRENRDAVTGYIQYYQPAFEGKTPDYVALVLRADGLTAVRDRDVLKAAGRI